MDFTTHPPPAAPLDYFACIISGDGIFNPLARYLAKRLAQRGIATARVKAIKYFWTKRSPKRMSRDLERYMTARLTNKPSATFVFIGYSFGAGTLPIALNALPLLFQEKIKGVVLIAPPEKADFEFYFRSWLHKVSDKAQPVAPQIQTLSRRVPVLYIHGADDYVGTRRDLTASDAVHIVSLQGGHNFNKNYAPLFDVIKSEIFQTQTSGCSEESDFGGPA